ncbi:TIGR00730 family Rossman fold protein [Singulisphaera sp. Ch08]|uniref:Cytokinin riboside 5'-monophosphate phosphoribohydrolase n=1 Tax=Singulisphaera sp. Ch08 TaxID=3120278 RepID=A0AAU7CT91_9BACT
MGSRPAYADAAQRVGSAIATNRLGLVYGGGRVGLMGVVADATLAGGGPVVGVIPDPLATKEVAHRGVTELIVVPGMHERKAKMAERAAGFLTLPGGVGTLEEFFEIITWAVLGLHRKPIGILNVDGYFDSLLAFLDDSVAQGFVRPAHRELMVVSDNPETLVANLLDHTMPPVGRRWIESDET